MDCSFVLQYVRREQGPHNASCYWLQGMKEGLYLHALSTSLWPGNFYTALLPFTSAQGQTLMVKFSSLSLQVR